MQDETRSRDDDLDKTNEREREQGPTLTLVTMTSSAQAASDATTTTDSTACVPGENGTWSAQQAGRGHDRVDERANERITSAGKERVWCLWAAESDHRQEREGEREQCAIDQILQGGRNRSGHAR